MLYLFQKGSARVRRMLLRWLTLPYRVQSTALQPLQLPILLRYVRRGFATTVKVDLLSTIPATNRAKTSCDPDKEQQPVIDKRRRGGKAVEDP